MCLVCAAAAHYARAERVGRLPAIAVRAGGELPARAAHRQADGEDPAALPGRVRLHWYCPPSTLTSHPTHPPPSTLPYMLPAITCYRC